MPPHDPHHRAARGRRVAFTLVEMLVVIGIITLLAGLITASVMGAKRSANSSVGEMNMKSCGDVLLTHALSNKGNLYNPFVPGGDPGAVSIHPDGYSFGFGFQTRSRYTADGFAAYWYSYMSVMRPGEGLAMETFFSPADGEALSQFRSAAGTRGGAIFPGSFYLSPTFYRSPEVYDFTVWPEGCCESEHGRIYRGDSCTPDCSPIPCLKTSLMNLEMVAYPSAKVMLFERADFEQKQRSQVLGGVATVRRLPPAWNNPRAKPRVLTVDGSVSRAQIADLTARASADIRKDPTLSYVPVDLLAVPDLLPVAGRVGSSSEDIKPIGTGMGGLCLDDPTSTDGLYPMFFAATRGGIRGRDLPDR